MQSDDRFFHEFEKHSLPTPLRINLRPSSHFSHQNLLKEVATL